MNIEPADQNQRGPRAFGGLFAVKPILYICVILGAVLATTFYKLRTDGIFSCSAGGYAADWYMAYCHSKGYGDYEHGSFWFDLEPSVANFAGGAKVLFLGSSRMQLALSTSSTAEWFASASAPYYLLGFGYNEKVGFEQELLRHLNPRAIVYVVSIDGFFARTQTIPAKTVMQDSDAKFHYQGKRLWQLVHRPICQTIPAICGDTYVIFRSRETGAYRISGEKQFKGEAVSYDRTADRTATELQAEIGKEFLATLPVKRECVILTMIPYVDTEIETGNAIAAALGTTLVAPMLDGLQTFDGSHLDRSSADRWSRAFLDAAGPRIRKCLDEAKGFQS